MGSSSADEHRSYRVEIILAEYMDRLDSGEPVDREAFVTAHAEVAEELRAHFAAEDAISDLIGRSAPVVASLTTAPLPRRFGDYELLEEIGRGGMGVVYRAHHRSLDRAVAVKLMLAGQLAGEQDVRRFQGEAQAAASLKHPHIVAIHEVGAEQGQHYFSMDHIEGQSLSALVRSDPLPHRKAAEYVAKVARAIHFAHEHGVLHRDLKPANILIDGNGEPHVTDFGLARRMRADFALTTSGVIVGSPCYMPPEQVSRSRGRLGPHSDVYALGATLYELLTGCAPFVGESILDVITQVLDAEVSRPKSAAGRIPRDLETICMVCLRKKPADRYCDASELAADLERWLSDKPRRTTSRHCGAGRRALQE